MRSVAAGRMVTEGRGVVRHLAGSGATGLSACPPSANACRSAWPEERIGEPPATFANPGSL